MALPKTSKSRTATLRLPVEKLDTVEAIAEEHGLTRHRLIKLCVFDALRTGAIVDLAKSAQNVKSPA
ncbi:hypothetical protein ACQ4N7_29265 [Nodosilinea sp. AN01ver1]|uniref:hypothetical protein n=1 Tax=Nodosilinea sp. AN01ver1 TaxID=3423362 RepID=UPI003D31C8E3